MLIHLGPCPTWSSCPESVQQLDAEINIRNPCDRQPNTHWCASHCSHRILSLSALMFLQRKNSHCTPCVSFPTALLLESPLTPQCKADASLPLSPTHSAAPKTLAPPATSLSFGTRGLLGERGDRLIVDMCDGTQSHSFCNLFGAMRSRFCQRPLDNDLRNCEMKAPGHSLILLAASP